MGIFGFLKKGKADTATAEMELPPLPSMDDLGGFPQAHKEELPPLPDSFLPPLPTEFPSSVPPAPQETTIKAPRFEMSMPAPQEKPEPQKIEVTKPVESHEEDMHETSPTMEFPAMPDMPSEEVVPDTVPPLEELPEPPEYTYVPEKREIPKMEMQRPEPVEEIIPRYAPEEMEPQKRRLVRGPTFMKTESVRTMLENIELIRTKFKDEDDVFFRITEIKNVQDQKYEGFRQTLEDMQRKLLFIDKTLFESR